MCVAAPAYVTDGSEALARPRARPVPLVRRDGRKPRRRHRRPLRRRRRRGAASLTDYIAGRQGYDYNEHGRAGNTHTEFVPDEIVERFCIIGPPETHIERLRELAAVGVGHFGLYLQHDAQDATLAAFGDRRDPGRQRHLLARG